MTIPVPAPPKNGERPVVKKRRESSDRSIKSWSLMQKDRDPEHFIPNVGYADRASFEIREPVFQLANADGGRRLESELRIIVLDADGEFKDNVVVAQYPLLDRPLKSGERLTISYKMRVGR